MGALRIRIRSLYWNRRNTQCSRQKGTWSHRTGTRHGVPVRPKSPTPGRKGRRRVEAQCRWGVRSTANRAGTPTEPPSATRGQRPVAAGAGRPSEPAYGWTPQRCREYSSGNACDVEPCAHAAEREARVEPGDRATGRDPRSGSRPSRRAPPSAAKGDDGWRPNAGGESGARRTVSGSSLRATPSHPWPTTEGRGGWLAVSGRLAPPAVCRVAERADREAEIDRKARRSSA